MSSSSKALYGVVLAMHGAVMALWGAAMIAGREIIWHYPIGTAVVLFLLSAAATVRLFLKPQESGAGAVVFALMLLSMAVVVPLASGANAWVLLANVATVLVAVVRIAKPLATKIVIGVLFSLMLSVAALVLSIASAVIGLRHTEVIDEQVSPGGQYAAQVVAISSGALGGDTTVEVHEISTQIKLGLCTIEKPVQTLQWFETYRDHDSVTIAWEDEDTLHILGDVEYDVDKTVDISFE